jgi:competence protein ComEC
MGVLSARAELWLAGASGVTPAVAWRRFARGRIGLLDVAGLLDAEQDRWFLWVPVFVGIGVGTYFAAPVEPLWILTVAPLLAAIGLKLTVRRGMIGLALTGALMCAALGYAAAKLRVEWVRGPVVPFSKRIQTVHGWVEVVERRAEKGVRLTIRVASIDGFAAEATPIRVRVTSKFGNNGVLAGDALTIRAMLQPPPQPAEPNGYDFARQAWFAGVGGVGFSIGRPVRADGLAGMPWWTGVKTTFERMREEISLRITSALPGPTGLVTDALVTGEQKSIPPEITDALRDSGLSHILAISGLQITIMAGAFFGLARGVLAAFPQVALRWPVKKIATAAGLLGATVYVIMSGAGSATCRAYVMVAVGLLAVLLDRPGLSMRNLAIAALCLILPQPETLLDPSFQMSFSAVVALMAAYEWAGDWARPGAHVGGSRRSRPKANAGAFDWILWGAGWFGRIVRETFAATAIATLAVAPFSLFTFHRLPVYGILANILAEPLFNLIIMPLVAVVLAAMPFGLEAWPLLLVDQCVGLMLAIARWVSALPGAVVLVPQMPVLALGAITLGGAWLCLWRQQWRYLGLILVGAGMLMAVRGEAADVLIGREGTPVAIRLGTGELSALPGKGGAFDLAQWLEADADGRDVGMLRSGAGFRCDGVGCTALVGGKLLAISDAPASLGDDCANAAIVILRYRQPAPCVGPALVLDARDLRAGGAHAIRILGGRPVIETVAAGRGDRPWAMATSLASTTSQVEDFATPGWQHGAAKRFASRKQIRPLTDQAAGMAASPVKHKPEKPTKAVSKARPHRKTGHEPTPQQQAKPASAKLRSDLASLAQ